MWPFEKSVSKKKKKGGSPLDGAEDCGLWEGHFWPKPFCDLSLATVLVLEQVSVISDLKVTKLCKNKLLSGKRSNNSKDKTPSSVLQKKD